MGKKRPIYSCIQVIHFRPKDIFRFIVKGWRMIYHANGCQKEARVAIFMSDKIDCKTKTVTRDKEGHYIIIKGQSNKKTQQLKFYASNIGYPNAQNS